MIVRHAVKVNGVTDIAVTKLDVLDDLEKIKVCTAYSVRGKVIKDFPSNIADLRDAKPVYTELAGWKRDTTNISRFQDLPSNAKRYLKFLLKIVQAPISIVSTGPKRSQTFFLS